MMTRSLLLGAYACLVSLAATFGGAYWRTHPSTENGGHIDARQITTIKPITVPLIANGALKGYVTVAFSIVSEKEDPHDVGIEPSSFVMDEAFRLIYGESKVDYARAEKTDLAALTRQLTLNVNQRLGRSVIKETLIRSFAFIPRDETPR
ncbi:hypothetical protein [Methylocystis parvus]|uniref:Flagellar basal body-associated protein FliL n=1 Tax=Methylocystis parvus TaxID=134 RepID=A0A6B8LZW2_9HYPH|nr:hypothetical protein [Methylocystis parvus]QGM97997.1 flagellar basal body-associated protein FliL [Methylocystis parvus]WBK01688.1 flagellar basal body-associated protein FliL [Methylocystis parvus OBBP]